MVLPREFSAVEQSKALSTFGCQVFCLCFSKLCPGGAWKANNLWVVLMEQNLRENKICFRYQNFAEYQLCCSVLQTWRHLSGGGGSRSGDAGRPGGTHRWHNLQRHGSRHSIVLVTRLCEPMAC